MEAWKNLVNTTLLGSEKTSEGIDFLSALPGLARAQQALSVKAGDSETRLLETTAILYVYRRCGTVPLSAPINAEVAQPESRPYCSNEATNILKDLLQTGSTGLLQLWLERCNAKGCIVPPVMIDTLLQTAAQQKALRSLIVSCCGKRGEWLCRLNPDWHFHTEGSNEERWDTGTLAERAEILRLVRIKEPSLARTMLEQVWGREKADVKEALLLSMEPGLAEDDLPFLESVTNDKSKRVQAIAYDFLTRLPGSSIVKAFEEILRQSIRLQTTKKLLGMMSRTSLEIVFPKSLDKQLLDAIGRKPNGAGGQSEEEFRLLRMMSAVPPSFWEGHLGLPPQRVLALFEDVSPDGTYKDALREATIRHGAKPWAPLFKNGQEPLRPGLLPLLSANEQKDYLLSSAKTAPEGVIDYYSSQGIEWSPQLAPILISFVAANPYQYSKAFFNANAPLIPLSIRPALPSFKLAADSQPTDYAKQYAAQVWQGTSEYLSMLLSLKAATVAAFHNHDNIPHS